MTAPGPRPSWSPVPSPTWCTTCQIHRATAAQPLCPVCLDEKAKKP